MATLQRNPHPEFETAASIKALSFAEGNFVARRINSADRDDVYAYQSLRHEWFVQRRGWVPEDAASPGRETDDYDGFCHHLGVFQENMLVAYLRALPWRPEPGLMLQKEFRWLVGDGGFDEMAKPGSVEISRLVVAPLPGTPRHETANLAELLFKLFYNLGKCVGWETFYIVLEEPWLRTLNRRFGLPFAPIGDPYVFADGTRTLAASVRCDVVEDTMLAHSPEKYHWYRQPLD